MASKLEDLSVPNRQGISLGPSDKEADSSCIRLLMTIGPDYLDNKAESAAHILAW